MYEFVIVYLEVVELEHETILYLIFSYFDCAIQLTYFTRIIIRVHILLKLLANNNNIAKD